MERRIKQIIAEELFLEEEDLLDDMHLISELDYSEESFLSLIMELEELLNIELDELMLIEMDRKSDCFYFEDESILDEEEINLITIKDLIMYLDIKCKI